MKADAIAYVRYFFKNQNLYLSDADILFLIENRETIHEMLLCAAMHLKDGESGR
jgi:hypothetical protein